MKKLEMVIVYLHEHTSLRSLKGTLSFNPMRYSGVSIENTYCYWLPSTMTQSIENIWSVYDIARRSKLLLTLAQTQYSLKVERQHNKVA